MYKKYELHLKIYEACESFGHKKESGAGIGGNGACAKVKPLTD